MGKAGTRLGSRMAWSWLALKWFALAGATGIQLVVPTLPRLRSLVSSFLKGSERLSLRNIYSVAINNIQGGGRVKNTRQWWKLSLRGDERWIRRWSLMMREGRWASWEKRKGERWASGTASVVGSARKPFSFLKTLKWSVHFYIATTHYIKILKSTFCSQALNLQFHH